MISENRADPKRQVIADHGVKQLVRCEPLVLISARAVSFDRRVRADASHLSH